MSYFGATTGSRALPAPHSLQLWPAGAGWMLTWAAPPVGITQALVLAGTNKLTMIASVQAQACRWMLPPDSGARFALCWQAAKQSGPQSTLVELPGPPAAPTQERACPLCQTILQHAGAWWHCNGRCGTRWLETSSGQLMDPASLPWGLCSCCSRPQPLSRTTMILHCPSTSIQYFPDSSGQLQPATPLPHGRCECCVPAQPLIEQNQRVYCPHHPHTTYIRTAQGWQLKPHTAANPTLEAIDAALHANSANWTLYGLFDIDNA